MPARHAGPVLYNHPVELQSKLAILADAAKYDASCASSGGKHRDSRDGRGLGSNDGTGICHSYAPDGRCISLLKILLTNFCQYDCLYCVNRVSSDVPRARFSVDEVVQLTLEFYRRNCIEGLFLSSGIIRSADYTMEQLVEVARRLREEHAFRGYIHLKTIPDASPELLRRAGRYADRLSINVELPTERALTTLAPQKDGGGIRRSMARLRVLIDDARDEKRERAAAPVTSIPGAAPSRSAPPPFATGQSTQMIVGADAANDATILSTSATLYGAYRLRRVYYSAFSPIEHASSTLPAQAPRLLREHRLYQADWLMRYYGFAPHEIVPAGQDGMLSLDVDPKLAWALAHPERFPVDANTAPRELLLRVPGLGVKTIDRLLAARRVRRLCSADLKRLQVPMRKAMPFLVLSDHRPGKPSTVSVAAALRATQAARALGTGAASAQAALF